MASRYNRIIRRDSERALAYNAVSKCLPEVDSDVADTLSDPSRLAGLIARAHSGEDREKSIFNKLI